MTRGILTSLAVIAAGVLTLSVLGCRRGSEESSLKSGFEEFVPVYNRYIEKWVKAQQSATDEEAAKTRGELATADPTLREKLEARLRKLEKDQEKWRFRLSLGDFLKFAKPSDLPPDLKWVDGMDQPEIGDPAAIKGGVFRRYIPTFPPTLRPFGENSNNSFRGDIYDNVDMPLVTLHLQTMREIPGLAKEWALSADKRTVYFRIDPEARFSDGEPVLARDFMLDAYLRISDNIVNPFTKQYYREEIAQIAVYDDRTLSVSLPAPKLFAAAIAGAMEPASPKFYQEYGPDYSDRYQWRFPPTTGAYEVMPEDVVKGVSVTQTRVKNWWAKDRKYYRYRYNPDKIISTVVRDDPKAFELFRAGELDTFLLTRPERWYEKSEIDPVYKGYIERVTFYNRYPRVPLGMYLNVSKPLLNDRNVRIGIQHAMNWQKVIDVIFRGDYQRLNSFNEGYGIFSDPSIKARPFSVELARESFRAAGFTSEGPDGILTKPDGTRLSIAVSYPNQSIFDRIMPMLREDAKRCGFDLRLDGQEFTVSYKKEMQKQHEITVGSWNITPPVPDFYEFLHSSNAYDEKGNLRPQTNNTFVWGRADTDDLCEKVRAASTDEELRDAAWRLQNIMHDEAIFVPGFSVDFVRVGSWRWVRWPDCGNTRFSPPCVFDPHDSYVYWVDEKLRDETQAARRAGKAFSESTTIVDAYREKTPARETTTDEEGPKP